MEFVYLLLEVALALACCTLGQAQVLAPTPQMGDIRLINGTSPGTSGLVQVYFKDADGKNAGWRYICGANTKDTTDTICRQLGFIDTHSSKTVQQSSSQYWFTSLTCQRNTQHILRCSWQTGGSCVDALYIECDPFRIWETVDELQAYSGQVQLCNRNVNASSRGRLVVFNKQSTELAWGSVNNKDSIVFSREDADSACRELGYTGSVPGSIEKGTPIECISVTKKWAQVSSDSCTGGVSYPCFGCCFSVDPSTDTCVGCSPINDIVIQCTFDIDYRNPPTAGNSSICHYDSGSKPHNVCTAPGTNITNTTCSRIVNDIIIGAVVVIVAVVIAVAITVVSVVWMILRHKRTVLSLQNRNSAESLLNKADDGNHDYDAHQTELLLPSVPWAASSDATGKAKPQNRHGIESIGQ